jgi:hypothetical protein
MPPLDHLRLESLRDVIGGQIDLISIENVKHSMFDLVSKLTYNDLWRLMMGELMTFVAADLPEFNVMLIQVDVVENKADVTLCVALSHRNVGQCSIYWQNLDLIKRIYATYQNHYAHLQLDETIPQVE